MTCKCYKNEPVKVEFEKLYDDVKLPSYAHEGDSGMDVFAREETVIGSGATVLFPLGFKIAIPDGYEVQVRTKSGLALKKQLIVLNSPGTIDSNYRGECGVILHNAGPNTQMVEEGSKIAQIVLAPVSKMDFEVVDSLEDTTRGEGGFGSTGLK